MGLYNRRNSYFFGWFSAINAKALSVNLNEELTTLEGLTFTAKRGTTSVVLTPKLSEDKKSIELSSSTNLVAGEYTVTVTGGEFVEGKNAGTVTVAAQKIGKIEFTGNVLAKTGPGTATVGFKVFDQYNTDVTGSASSLINNINWSANVAVASLNDANGVLTIDLAGDTDFAANQTILITAVDSVTGTTKSTNFTVGTAAAVKTLTLGDVVLPKDTSRIYAGSATAATIAFTAKDQYDNKLETAAKLNGVTLLSSDSAVVPSFVDVDGKAVLNINTTNLSVAKNVTITAVINATGETVTKTLEVVLPAKPDVVTLGQLETNVIATGDAAGKFVLPITVTDQFGTTLTAKQIAAAYSDGTLAVTGTGSLSAATLRVNTDSTSANYGKVVNTEAVSDAAGVGTVVVTTASGKTASTNYTTVAARKVSEIAAPTTVTTNLISGATTSYTYKYKDQYGDTVTPSAANRNADLKWEVTVTDLTGDAGAITVNKTAGDDEDAIGTVTVTAVSGKTGSAKVSAKLLNASNEVVSQVENTFKVVANNAEGLTYEISDIATLNGSQDGTVDGADEYARAITVKAKDASGAEYAIPSSSIISVTSSDTDVATVSGARLDDSAAIDAQDGEWVVTGENITAGNDATQTAVVTVQVNTQSGVKVLTKEVTVSKAQPKAQELKFVSAAATTANPYALPTGTTDVTALSFTNQAAIELGSTAFLVTKDQYGVFSTVAKDLIVNTPSFVTLGDGDKFEVSQAGVLKLTDANADDALVVVGENVVLTAVHGTLTDTITVKVTTP